jgi:lactose/L-arabinose transport system substrate-binding protein
MLRNLKHVIVLFSITLLAFATVLNAGAQDATPAPTLEPVTLSPEAQAFVDSTEVIDANLSGTVEVWGWSAAMRDTMDASGVISAFKKAYPNVTVNVTLYGPSDVYTNLPLALTAGEGACDVCLVESSHLAQFVALGGLLDLTDRVQPYLETMNAYRWKDTLYDGHYYAMPWDSGPVVMYYRRDVLEKAGLPSDPAEVDNLVSTWDGYMQMCKTIKDATGLSCFALNRANNSGRLYEMMLWQQGLGYYSSETGEITVDSPENIATLEKLGQFWSEDLVSDNQEWTAEWYDEFASTDTPVATFVEASWMEVFLKSWIAPGTAGLWGVAHMPAFSDGQVRAANDGGSTFVIPEQTKNPDAAWAFVDFTLGQRESQLRMFEVSGFIPALETTYASPVFEQPDPFFADQSTRTVYAEVVKEIPDATVYGPQYQMMNGVVSVAIQRYAAGEVTAEQALQEAAEEIRANAD